MTNEARYEGIAEMTKSLLMDVVDVIEGVSKGLDVRRWGFILNTMSEHAQACNDRALHDELVCLKIQAFRSGVQYAEIRIALRMILRYADMAKNENK